MYPSPGGIGRYSAKLLTILPRLFPADTMVGFAAAHRVAALRAAWLSAGMGEVALPVRLPLPRPLLYDAWHLIGLPPLGVSSRSLRGVEVIHAPSVAVPPKDGASLVVTVHDVAASLYPEAFSSRGRSFHARGLAAAERRADLVIAVSQAGADEIVSHSGIGVDRIRVVPNGVDMAPTRPADIERVTRTYRLEGRRYVLWVGSLEPRKGVGTLVGAMAALRRRAASTSDVELVLAGYGGWRNDDLIDSNDRRVLGDSLRLIGRVAEADIAGLYAGAAAFVLPSLHEGFGLPVLEAMSQSTPVLCSDIAALREVAAGAALLVAPGHVGAWADALETVLTDESLRRSLVDAGRARAAAMTWDRTVAATHAVYDEAASG